jgi:2-oxoglutarate ferredoxin oxidoreductase subunit alpha
LRFAIHAGHGEFARIVIASGDIQECYYDAALAFNYAERFQVPVIHLLDKAMANSSDTYPVFETSKIIIERGELLDSEGLQKHIMQRGDYRRFRLTESGISPRVVLGTPGTVIWNTGDERDEFGHISENPTNRTRMMDKRMKKLDLIEREVSVSEKVNTYRTTGPAATVVSWGSTKGSVLEARELLNREGIEVNFLQVRMLHPFPAADLGRLLSGASKIIDIEMNYSGQLASILREKTGITVDHLIVKYNGRPMTSDEVYSALKNAISGKAGKREVLTGGA